MKPFIDISRQKSFTVWESGYWNKERNFGSSVIVAGPGGEQQNIIYDRPPAQGIKHALFYANAEMLLVGAYVRPVGDDTYNYLLEMERITELWTKTVQGEVVPHIVTKTVWLMRATTPRFSSNEELLKRMPDLPSVPNAQQLMDLAIIKALTLQQQQQVFWGIARQRQEQDAPTDEGTETELGIESVHEDQPPEWYQDPAN